MYTVEISNTQVEALMLTLHISIQVSASMSSISISLSILHAELRRLIAINILSAVSSSMASLACQL